MQRIKRARYASPQSKGQEQSAEEKEEKDINRDERRVEGRKRGNRCTEQIEKRIEAESQQSARMELGGNPRETSARPRGIPGLCNHQFAYPIQFWSHSSRPPRPARPFARGSRLCSFLTVSFSPSLFSPCMLLPSSLSPFFLEPAVSPFFHSTLCCIFPLRYENFSPFCSSSFRPRENGLTPVNK